MHTDARRATDRGGREQRICRSTAVAAAAAPGGIGRLVIVALLIATLAGCSDDNPCTCDLATPESAPAPQGLEQGTFAGRTLEFWPYTGAVLDGTPSDPINLVFVGQAAPEELRAALLSLDGDRSAADFPPVEPFTGLWQDANGDVQASYSTSSGWTGSVIQLQLGGYGPLRVHLRLFATAAPWGETGVWTLGSAHFELLIPGTADHQVLSWELAEQVVAADLLRSGLLDTETPTGSLAALHEAPGFREIPAMLYNELPLELRALIQGPLADVDAPVPIATGGDATVLHVAGSVPCSPGVCTESFAMTYDQVVPKPFCSDGPQDWVRVAGPIEFHKTVIIAADGGYRYESGYYGELTVTPLDLSTDPPSPAGESYTAVVSDAQQGETRGSDWRVTSETERVAPQTGGTEYLVATLRLSAGGERTGTSASECLAPDAPPKAPPPLRGAADAALFRGADVARRPRFPVP